MDGCVKRLLEQTTHNDVSNDALPFMHVRDIRIGYAPALAFRVSYIGELGWELYIPVEYVLYAFDQLWRAGQDFGITNIGYRAIDSLRLEKGNLAWGTDITPDDTPIEAGLGFAVGWSKSEFMGSDALYRMREEGPLRRMRCLVMEDPLPVFGGEAILVNGEPVAQSTSGSFGHSIQRSLVLGYLPVDCLDATDLEVETFGERSAAKLLSRPAYDPERRKILC